MTGTGPPGTAVPPSGRIEVRGLRVVGTHGVLEEEQGRPQPFEVDLDLDVDLARAARSDRLEDTVDYGAVVAAAAAVVAGPQRFALLEALARAVAEAALATSPLLGAATVTLRKLRPPLAADLVSVGVRLTVGRPGGVGPDAR